MFSKMGPALCLGAALGAASPAAADEVVHFMNGTSMPILGHKVEKDMINVDLGSNASMSFPLSMVEWVENAGRNVLTGDSYRPSNQATAGVPGAVATRGPSEPPVPSRYMGSRSTRNRNLVDPMNRFDGVQGSSGGGDVMQTQPTPFTPGAVGQPVLGTRPMGRFNALRTPGGRPLSHSGLPITGLQPLSEAKGNPAPPAGTKPANPPEPPPPPDGTPPENRGSSETPEPGS